MGNFLKSCGSGSAGRFLRREPPPLFGSAPHALTLSPCEHLSWIGTDKCDAEAEPGATLSLRGFPAPRPAGTEVRARIAPASTPENSIGRCAWPPGIRRRPQVLVRSRRGTTPRRCRGMSCSPPGVAAVAADRCRFPQALPVTTETFQRPSTFRTRSDAPRRRWISFTRSPRPCID